ncbi:hypothetical protein Tco_0657021 [Tanacetum coccineum]|uniref:Uncharacterized protein n=1 Tax=Tanacetum coccineum TaxID=301880 RepID=A0ABQ4XAE6_9ASTR
MSHRLAVITVTLLQSTRKDTTITTSLPEITPFIALQLRVARLEQEMSEVKKTDHSADVLASIRSQVPTAVDKYLGTESMMLPKVLARTQQIYSRILWVDWPRVYPNQESERVEGVYQNPKGNKIKSANRNPANYHLYHALMEAFIADEDVMDKEVADKVKDHKRKHDSNDDEDDDDDEGPSAGSNQARESDASATKQHLTLTSTGWQITDTRDAGSDEGHVSDPEDNDNAHMPKIPDTTTWFRLIPEEERSASLPIDLPEADNMVIPPIDLPKADNNWANAFVKAHQDPDENKLHNKIEDIGSFIRWYCQRIGKEELSKADLEGPAFMMVKVFHENNTSLQFQMEECHKLLTNQIDLVNPEGYRIVPDLSNPLPLGGPPALSISKLKAALYPDFGLEELVPSLWIESEREYDISAAYGITHWKMMRINEVHKFSDGTLTRIKEKRDFMVKDFKLFKFNKGMENRKWTEDDKRRSEDFIEMIERNLEQEIFESRKLHPSETKVFHNEDGNPARANIKQALGSYERSHKGVKASANSDIVYFFTSAQDGDPLQDDVRLCLADDLKKAQDHNQRQVNDESKDHYPKCIRYQMKNQMSTSKD